jgi:hypothetical protein
MPWEEVQAELASHSEEAERLYDQAMDGGPEQIADDLQTLRDYTDDVFDAAREAENLDEFVEAYTALGDAPLQAVVNIDTFLQEHCGFGLSEE